MLSRRQNLSGDGPGRKTVQYVNQFEALAFTRATLREAQQKVKIGTEFVIPLGRDHPLPGEHARPFPVHDEAHKV
jgi:hypothetical protein